MPPRHPTSYLFGALVAALLLPKSAKVPTKDRVIVLDTMEVQYDTANTTLPPTTPPLTTALPTGFLSSFLSILDVIVSVLGDEVLNYIGALLFAMFLYYLIALARATKRFCLWIFGSTNGLWQALGRCERVPETTTASEEQAASEAVENQMMTKLQTQILRKDTYINSLHATARNSAKTITDLRDQTVHLDRTLRAVLDPTGLHKETKDVSVLAEDLARDHDRVSKKLESQHKELNAARNADGMAQLALKESQMSALTEENSRLGTQISGLQEGERASRGEVKRIEESAEEKIKHHRERAEAAESAARQAISPREHDVLRDQMEIVVVELRRVREESERLTSELQAERERVQELQTGAGTTDDAAAESHAEYENRFTSTANDLELARQRITTLETEAVEKAEEVRQAERKAKAAEDKTAETKAFTTKTSQLEQDLKAAQETAADKTAEIETATTSKSQLEQALKEAQEAAADKTAEIETVTTSKVQLEQDLKEAQDQAKRWQDSHDQLTREVQEEKETREKNAEAQLQAGGTKSDEEAVAEQSGEAKPRANDANPNEELIAEVDSLRGQLAEANTAQHNALRSAAVEKETLKNEVRTETVQLCKQEHLRVLGEAIVKERDAAAIRQADAVTQKEQAVKDECQKAWDERRKEWEAAANAAVEKGNQLTNERDSAVERAIAAEDKYDNPDALVQEARGEAILMRDRALLEIKRANAAEEEVEKFKQGKKSQDERIQNLRDEIAQLQREKVQNQETMTRAKKILAEFQAVMNDRSRAQAMVEELLYRHYDFDSKQVLIKLIGANTKIASLEKKLKNASTQSSKILLLRELLDAEVDEKKVHEISKTDYRYRQVLVRQCSAVNAKLKSLKSIINSSEQPDMEELLEEIWKGRGDEDAEFNDEESHPTKPESDEDGDDDAADDAITNRPRVINAMRRPTPGLLGQKLVLKGPRKPGSSIPAANDDQDETKPTSQNDLPSSAHIGEASAPRTQSSDQAYVGKPTKIPGPKPRPTERQERLAGIQHQDDKAAPEQCAIPSTPQGPSFSFSAPKDIASVAVSSTPVQPSHNTIFSGLARLGAAVADQSALSASATPAPEEDEVLEFDSWDATPDQASDSEPHDEFQAHTFSDDEEDLETLWEDALNPQKQDGDNDFDLHADFEPSTIRALDQTEQNYEEQEAEARAAMQGVQQAPAPRQSQPSTEEEEDNFHIDLDY